MGIQLHVYGDMVSTAECSTVSLGRHGESSGYVSVPMCTKWKTWGEFRIRFSADVYLVTCRRVA
jgi:hypothetical protein